MRTIIFLSLFVVSSVALAADADSCVLIETTSKKLIQAKSVTLSEGDWNIVTADGVGITLKAADVQAVKSKALPAPDEHVQKIEELEKSILFKDKTIEKLKAEKAKIESVSTELIGVSEEAKKAIIAASEKIKTLADENTSLKRNLAAVPVATPNPAATPYSAPKIYYTPTPVPVYTAAPTPSNSDLSASVKIAGESLIAISNTGDQKWLDIEVDLNGGIFSSGYYLESQKNVAPGNGIEFDLRTFANKKSERFDPSRMKLRTVTITAGCVDKKTRIGTFYLND